MILLFLLHFAPACAPDRSPPGKDRQQNLVLLTDTTQWSTPALQAYTDSLAENGYRVLISGYPGESAAELTLRLPWLLQPGVDLIIYDERLAGAAAADGITGYLAHKNAYTKLVVLSR